MIKKILFWLFPGTINEIITDAMIEADIVHHYGSVEEYHKHLREYAEDSEREEFEFRQMLMHEEESHSGWEDDREINEESPV